MKLIVLLLCITVTATVSIDFPDIRARNLRNLNRNREDSISHLSKGIIPNIVGGQEVIPNSVPYQVSLQRPGSNFSWGLLCGGSIISPTKIVTAAHCLLFTADSSELRVVAGDHDLKLSDGHEQIVPVANFTTHPFYSLFIGDYDYGVVHLAKPLRFNKYVAPIQLPTGDYVPSGFCTATGWGATSGDGKEMPNKLQGLTLPLVTREECAATYAAAGSEYNVTENMICVGGTEGKSLCGGDSGGPLACNGVLAGIASWTQKPCGQDGFPGVYANVASGLDWILNN